MRFLKYIYAASVVLVGLMAFSSCDSDDDSKLSKAVLASSSTLNFDGMNSMEELITIYADAEWETEAPEWITVTPSKGTGVTGVTISVADNMRGGALDNPRKGTIIFKGQTLASRALVLVMQDGDKYRDLEEYKVNELDALANETMVSVPKLTVMAVTEAGFVGTDAQKTGNLYVMGKSAVQVGDVVSVMGAKNLNSQSLILVELDRLETVSSGGTVSYPSATDITDQVTTYKPTTREFVSVSGTLNGANVVIEGTNFVVGILDAPAALGLGALNGHKVTVKGYFAGLAAPVLRVMAAEIEDRGVDKVIYFSEDFEWFEPYSVASGAGKTVETSNSGATAPNVHTVAGLKDSFLPELLGMGYELICAPNTTTSTYLQQNYLKFGRTDVQAGIVLPPIKNVPAGTKVRIAFDWAPMVGGTGKFDPVEVIVLIKNGGTEEQVYEAGHDLVDTVDALKWFHAEFEVSGVNIDENTKITIRSKKWEATKTTDGASVYQRWFIDNIEITKAE